MSDNSVRPTAYRDVSPREAAQGLHEVRIIDVREPDEFVGPLGHIPGAELVPLATVGEASRGWSREQPLLVVCRTGGRSSKAATLFGAAGFTARNLVGGMTAWRSESLPVEPREER